MADTAIIKIVAIAFIKKPSLHASARSRIAHVSVSASHSQARVSMCATAKQATAIFQTRTLRVETGQYRR
jgi:hypothetical protein